MLVRRQLTRGLAPVHFRTRIVNFWVKMSKFKARTGSIVLENALFGLGNAISCKLLDGISLNLDCFLLMYVRQG